MAFFKFRSRGQKGEEQPVNAAESVDAMRRRARHRLIGATVLVLIGVVGFPLLFDTQPRPVQVDIPVVIPDRNKTQAPGQAAGGRLADAAPGAGASAPAAANAPGVGAVASLGDKEEVVPSSGAKITAAPAAPARAKAEGDGKADARTDPKPESRARPELKPAPAPETKVAKAAASSDDGAKARALLEGKSDASGGADAGRFVVQVGAFADADKAREVRLRVERAGLKTYTQVIKTRDGKRIRVRVGPYGQRAEADKAAGKIKNLDLPASILSL